MWTKPNGFFPPRSGKCVAEEGARSRRQQRVAQRAEGIAGDTAHEERLGLAHIVVVLDRVGHLDGVVAHTEPDRSRQKGDGDKKGEAVGGSVGQDVFLRGQYSEVEGRCRNRRPFG